MLSKSRFFLQSRSKLTFSAINNTTKRNQRKKYSVPRLQHLDQRAGPGLKDFLPEVQQVTAETNLNSEESIPYIDRDSIDGHGRQGVVYAYINMSSSFWSCHIRV